MKITRSQRIASDFPVGTKVWVVCELVDFYRFNSNKGVVIANDGVMVTVEFEPLCDVPTLILYPDCLELS